ncbi:MAG: hypothetical protein AAF957_20620 [Planctomycetota bacterium]
MKHPILAAGLLLLSTSCYTMVHDYGGSREITPGTTLSRPSENVGTINTSKNAYFLFWGLLPTNDASGATQAETAAIADYGENFDGISHVRIHEEQGALGVIVEIITLGIFSMYTVESEGQVRRFQGGDA